MSFIIVNFGYKQSKILGINCQVAPLLDAAHRLALSDANKAIVQKEEEFNKMLGEISQKIQTSKDRLDLLENPPPEPEETKVVKKAPPRKKAADSSQNKTQASVVEVTEEQKLEEAAKLEEEAKNKVEETKGKKAVDVKGKKAQEEAKKKATEAPAEPEFTPEELKQQRIEAEMVDLRTAIQEQTELAEKINEKIIKLKDTKVKLNKTITEFDLTDRVGDRKFLKTKMDEYANVVLVPKGQYTLVSINEEDEVDPFVIDGFCMRTPEEDETYVEEAVDPKKLAQQKAAAAKKK